MIASISQHKIIFAFRNLANASKGISYDQKLKKRTSTLCEESKRIFNGKSEGTDGGNEEGSFHSRHGTV